ncbi:MULTISPECIES: anti-sigma factor domain-containing protein [unclassified Brachybacterium]|uniref:anti-sigma factor n=1 Tax=unclassified Brachybacterium TaxID=2623841 RepID=UPI003615B044
MSEPQHSATGAWALNALDAGERARFEEYLAEDPDAAAEAGSFEETAGELARGLDPIAPRPELKDAVMGRIARTRQLPPPAGTRPAGDATDPDSHDPAVVPADRYRSSVRRTRWLAVAAALLLVTSVAGFGLWGSERAAEQEARATIEAMEEEHEMMSTIMAADDASHVTLPADPGGSLSLMYSRQQGAMLIEASDLPRPPEGSAYQVWLVDPAGYHSAGMITEPDDTVMMHGEVPSSAELGLTLEPMTGSDQPTSDPMMLGELS